MRVAVILPGRQRGAALRGVRDLCLLLREAGAEVACGLEEYALDEGELEPLRQVRIPLRLFRWRNVSAKEALVMVAQAALGTPDVERAGKWMVPDDGQSFLDARLWFVMGDRCELPLLPLRPYVLLVTGYPQRYEPGSFTAQDWKQYREGRRETALRAWRVLATGPGVLDDARHFVGVPVARSRLFSLPGPLPEPMPPATVCDPAAGHTAGDGQWSSAVAELRSLLAEAEDTLPPLIRGRVKHG